MVYINSEELLKKVGSRYKLVVLAARRTLELNAGKEKLIEAPPNIRLGTVAIKEIEEGKVGWRPKEGQKATE